MAFRRRDRYEPSNRALLVDIHRIVRFIMALVRIEQADLETIAETVSSTADDIDTVSDTLQAILDSDTPTPAADITSIQSALDKLSASKDKLDAVGPKTAPVDTPPTT